MEGRQRCVMRVTEVEPALYDLAGLVAQTQEEVMKRFWKLTSASIVFSLVLAASSTPSLAVGEAEARAACTGDVYRYCVSAIPNLDRIISCLKQKKQSISKPCQAVMSASGH
jgi:hypothetical protein